MLKLQIGAGLDGPAGWMNVDASPTLRLQRLPVAGKWLRNVTQPRFSSAVTYGDVVKGLPLPASSVDIVYSSHVLEHLAFDDCCAALVEIHRVLRPGGVLRSWLGNSRHLWMWDYRSLAHRLAQAGFVDIRPARIGDSSEPAFADVESPERWQDSLGFECRKSRDGA